MFNKIRVILGNLSGLGYSPLVMIALFVLVVRTSGGLTDWVYVKSLSQPGPNPGMCNVKNIAIKGDSLWANTSGGLMLYRISTGEKKFFKKIVDDNGGERLTLDSSGGLWLMRTNMGNASDSSYYLNLKTGAWSTLSKFSQNITTDKDGYVWIQKSVWPDTFGGLERFDGTRWKSFDRRNTTFPAGWKSTNPNPFVVNSICPSPDGNLWVGSQTQGLWKFDGDSLAVAFTTANYGLLSDAYIRKIIVDNESNIWFTCAEGLMCYDGIQMKAFPFGADLPGNNLLSILFGPGNKIYVGSATYGTVSGGLGEGLSVYDKNTRGWQNLNALNSGLPDNFINCLAKDNAGRIWIGTKNGGLVKLEGGVFQTMFLPSIPNYNLDDFVSDGQGGFWFKGQGSAQGLIHWDGRSAWTQSSSIIYPWSIAKGPDKQLWVSAYKQGITSFDGISKWTSYGESDGLTWNTATQIAVDKKKGFVWTNSKYCVGGGTPIQNMGLVFFNGVKWQCYDTTNSSLVNNDFVGPCLDTNGNAWIICKNATKNYCLVSFNGTQWTDPVDLGPIQNPTCLTVDNQNNIWIGTSGYGLLKFTGISSPLQYFSMTGTPLLTNDIAALTVDGSGKIWCGVTDISLNGKGGGIAEYSEGNWTYYTKDNSGLPANQIGQIWAGDSGRIWVLSGDGFCSFREEAITGSEHASPATHPAFNLELNPNPFNPSTVISVTGADRPIDISIFGLDGRKIYHYPNLAPEVELTWNARGFASGVYIVKATAGNRVCLKKILLQK